MFNSNKIKTLEEKIRSQSESIDRLYKSIDALENPFQYKIGDKINDFIVVDMERREWYSDTSDSINFNSWPIRQNVYTVYNDKIKNTTSMSECRLNEINKDK